MDGDSGVVISGGHPASAPAAPSEGKPVGGEPRHPREIIVDGESGVGIAGGRVTIQSVAFPARCVCV